MTSVIVTSEALNRKQLVRRSVPSTLNTCLASTHVFAGRGHRSDASALREIQLPIDEATDEWRNAFDSRKVVFSETVGPSASRASTLFGAYGPDVSIPDNRRWDSPSAWRLAQTEQPSTMHGDCVSVQLIVDLGCGPVRQDLTDDVVFPFVGVRGHQCKCKGVKSVSFESLVEEGFTQHQQVRACQPERALHVCDLDF